jgi:glycolate oxidase FAD binding subunit
MSLQPTNPEELQLMVRSNQALLPCGGGTKPALSTPTPGVTQLDLSQLSGIIEYEPSEYTFTAYAGTPAKEVATVLAGHGQYLPFDPLLLKQGATLGGTVAANTGGSGRYRYGGVRDFILGVRFVDGQGQLVRGGGKVVKNSAGFDLPKLMVGSLGRYGVFVDLSFKVFPEPRAYTSLQLTYPSLDLALQTIYRLSTTSFDIEALDLIPFDPPQFTLALRLGGLAEALPDRAGRLQNFLKTETNPARVETLQDEVETSFWDQARECCWAAPGLSLVKTPLSPKQIPALEQLLSPDIPRRYSAGGNVAWLAAPNLDDLDSRLSQLGLAGLVLLGPPGRSYLGLRKGLSLAQRVKKALDPAGKFLEV